jgi:hypothetical protein
MALAVAKSRGPSGIPARCPCPRMRLLERSSPGVQPSFTVTTRHPRPRLTGSCSPGVSLPFSASSIGDPRLRRLPASAPRLLFRVGIPPALPILPATVSPSGFFNLSATFSLHCRPTIFRRVTLLGFCPSGVFPFTQLRTAPRRRLALLTLLPWSIASVLSGSFLGHAPLLRSQRSRLSSSSGPSSA